MLLLLLLLLLKLRDPDRAGTARSGFARDEVCSPAKQANERAARSGRARVGASASRQSGLTRLTRASRAVEERLERDPRFHSSDQFRADAGMRGWSVGCGISRIWDPRDQGWQPGSRIRMRIRERSLLFPVVLLVYTMNSTVPVHVACSVLYHVLYEGAISNLGTGLLQG